MKGEGGESALVVVLLSVFCFGGCRGPVSFRAVKGKGVSQVWWWCCCRFLFWGAQGASQLPGCEGEGGESALVVVLLSVFVLGGAGGQSASGL